MGVYKKPNGKYYCRIQYKGHRQNLLCAGCKTEDDAKIFMSTALTHLVQVVNGVAKDDRKQIRFRDLTKVFLTYSETNKKDF